MKIIWYEDMVKDLRSVINDVSGFLGKNVAEDKIDQLIEHLSFDTFKKNDAVNMKPPKGSVPDEVRDKTNFIRKGKVGNWREYFDDNLVQELNNWVEENNKDLKVDFKFD